MPKRSKRDYDCMIENQLKDVMFKAQDLERAGILKGVSEKVGRRLDSYQNGSY